MAILLRYWWVIALALAALGLRWAISEYNDAQREAARSAVVVEQQADNLKEVEKASEARSEIIRPDTTVKYCQCVRSSRSGAAACKRFLPSAYAGDGKPAPECKGTGATRPE